MAKFQLEMGGKLEALTVGGARKPGTVIGPVVDATQLKQDLDYIDIGRSEDATLAFGDEALAEIGGRPGFYLRPALFTGATNAMRISREEMFGPVAAVIHVNDADKALAVANDTDHGLSAGVCTTSLKMAAHFKRHLQAGMVMVNAPTAGVDPRHRWASSHVQGGTPLNVLQKLGGWANGSMVQRYAHFATDHSAPWAERLAQSKANHGTNPSQLQTDQRPA